MPLFNQYIGIHYSGAETPTSSLKSLRVFAAQGDKEPEEVQPPTNPKRYWTRKAVAEFLIQALKSKNTLVGIDHGFSFPIQYFRKYSLTTYDQFLDDFWLHWPTDDEHVYVDFVRDGLNGKAAERTGKSTWLRVCEVRAKAKSVFDFDSPRNAAKSTHAGLPWLRSLRNTGVHRWPFDGWRVQGNVIAEVYPSLWKGRYGFSGTSHQHEAYTVCRWLQEMDLDGELQRYFDVHLSDEERRIAELEGWMLGVV